jgi:hypothetical protein
VWKPTHHDARAGADAKAHAAAADQAVQHVLYDKGSRSSIVKGGMMHSWMDGWVGLTLACMQGTKQQARQDAEKFHQRF